MVVKKQVKDKQLIQYIYKLIHNFLSDLTLYAICKKSEMWLKICIIGVFNIFNISNIATLYYQKLYDNFLNIIILLDHF